MRLNKFIALNTDYSRRKADELIGLKRVQVNGLDPQAGQQIEQQDVVTIDGKPIQTQIKLITALLHKPVGYVCSRNGQGSHTIYNLLPKNLQHLNSVGRLDKNSSGLLLMTNDGHMANRLTHPRYVKTKVYTVTLNAPLQPLHQQMISDFGIQLEDGPSKFIIQKDGNNLVITMTEGRNRQIRRTFEALGYQVKTLHRTQFGEYALDGLKPGDFKII